MAADSRQFGKYRILEELGAGGFATVFKAVDTTLEREVALKILHPPLLADRRFVQNFRQEARTLAALRHPQIITIYEVGEIEGRIFIAMDLARGASLARAIADRGRMPWHETLALLKPVCDALDYAHAQSVVHRDLKPANILIDRQRGALLTDFGFAKLLAENPASMTMSGGIVGTPGYIAPEVWENNAADPPVDIYALGCVTYEMLTGDILFKGQTPMQAMYGHSRGPQFSPTWPEDVPPKIVDVLAKALARDPANRYPSAGALWQALNGLEQQAQAAREAEQQLELARQEAARREAEAKREAEQRATLVAQWRAETERALAENNLPAARMAIGRWRTVAPDDPAIAAMQVRLDRLTTPSADQANDRPIPSPSRSIGSKIAATIGGLLFIILLIAVYINTRPKTSGTGFMPTSVSQPTTITTAAPSIQATSALVSQATVAPTSQPAISAPTAAIPTSAGGILRMSQAGWPDTLAPQKASFSNELAVLILNYEGLTRFDKNLDTMPAAAEKWEYNSDATQITFHLRDGLKYSDGSPLIAQDYVNAVYRTLDPYNPGDYQTLLYMIKGADAIINTEVPTDEAKLPGLYKALGVQALDDKTIVFNLTQPTPYFDTLAGTWVMYPVKQALIDKGGENWYEDAANQIGNGPFQIIKIDKSANRIEYKANENYWQGKPKLDGVQFTYIDDQAVALQAYKNGEVDVITPDPNDVPAIKADAILSKEYREYPGSCTFTLNMNLTKAPFDNPKVRQAFAYGFDRDGYIHDVLKDAEIKTLTWIPPGYPGHDSNENRFDYDPDKGKQMLAEAGFPNGEGLPEIKLSYSSSNPANQARIEYIAQMYEKSLGINIIPDPVEGVTLLRMRRSVDTFPQITTGGWCSDYPDPQDWLSIYWHSSSSFARNTGYKNSQVDRLTEQADVELDPAKRADLYRQAQSLVIADQGEIIRSNTKNAFLIKSNVQGIDFTPQDYDLPGLVTGLMNVTIQTQQ